MSTSSAPILPVVPSTHNIFWIDIETSDLLPYAPILEIFVMVTDGQLNIIDFIELIIRQNVEEMYEQGTLSHWASRQHKITNLLQAVGSSPISLERAESALIAFFDSYRQNSLAILAGSSVNFDQSVIRTQMPILSSRIHYRVIDVSSIMELARRWYPSLHKNAPQKSNTHRARDDVLSSHRLLQFYKSSFFMCPSPLLPSRDFVAPTNAHATNAHATNSK